MRRAAVIVSAVAVFLGHASAVAWAQNSPPKPESDCGLSRMCPRDPGVTTAGRAASWVVALILLAVLLVVLVAAYRAFVARQPDG